MTTPTQTSPKTFSHYLSLLFFHFTVPTLLVLFAIGAFGVFSYTKYQQKQLILSVVTQQDQMYQRFSENPQVHAVDSPNRLASDLIVENQRYFNETFLVLIISLACYLLMIIFIIRKLKSNASLLNSFILQLQGMNNELQNEINTRDQMAYQLATLNDDLKFQALHDTLTKLPNRRLFEDRLQSAITASKRHKLTFAVMLGDLDGFKLINDTLGHDVGDELLKEVAQRFNLTVREMDTVARLGGDEFAFIISNLNKPEEASLVADRLIRSLNKPIIVKNHQLNISTSLGITIYPTDSDNGQSLLKNADMAMYNSKNQGYGSFQFFREDMNTTSKRELLLRTDFVKALNQSQLSLHYQPIVDRQLHAISHFEALLRWQHPQLGTISPAEILRLADHLGVHLLLGEWIIEEVCRQLVEWKKQDFTVPQVCINVSAFQLEQNHFISKLQHTLQEYHIEPKQIILEITESGLIKNMPVMVKTFRELNALGFQIAIDDFGTGYSSLNYLRQLPVQILKIDQSFVAALNEDNQDSNNGIVRAIIALTQFLHLEVIAEGVETKQQMQSLQAMGCYKMQGYLFSKALPASDCLHLAVSS